MKNTILSIFALITGVLSAQDFIVTNGDNGVITEGEVLSFNTLGQDAYIHILIHNQSEENLYFKLKAESRQNTTGTDVNFCFGEVCLFSFNPGQYVPPTIYDAYLVSPGGTNHPQDKFFNMNEGDGENYPMIFEFGLYQYETPDQDQTTGIKVLSFSYQYSPSASTPSMTLQKLGVNVGNTVVNDSFTFALDNQMKLEVFDITGKSITGQSFGEGQNAFSTSNLSSGVYIAKFTDKQGRSASVKILK